MYHMYFLAYSHITSSWYIVDFQSKNCIWVPDLPFFFFLYNVWQVTSFPSILIRHLSNSNNNIYKGRLGYRYDFMSKYKAFHEMPGKCEIVNSLTHRHPTGLYVSWIRKHLFLYWIFRTWHVISVCLLKKLMNTLISKMDKPTN